MDFTTPPSLVSSGTSLRLRLEGEDCKLLEPEKRLALPSEEVFTRNLIRVSIHEKISGSIKVTTHLNHISHCKTYYGKRWSNRWTYQVSLMNAVRDSITKSDIASRASKCRAWSIHDESLIMKRAWQSRLGDNFRLRLESSRCRRSRERVVMNQSIGRGQYKAPPRS